MHDADLLSATALDPQAVLRQQRRLLRQGETPWLNALLAERMAERLEWIKAEVQQGLLWQGLHGGGMAALRKRYPHAELRSVEDLAQPLLQARKRWWQRVDWLSPETLREGQAQLLWANQSLLAATNLRVLFAQWHRLLAVDGFLMFSTLGPDSFIELRRVYQQAGFGPLAPQWVDLHDIGDLLVEAGFAEPVMDQERLTLTWPEPEALWRDLAQIGGNLHAGRFDGLRTPRWKARWLEAMATLRGADGRLALTLEFVCGHAIKPPPRLRMEAETRVSLEQMRGQLRKPRV